MNRIVYMVIKNIFYIPNWFYHVWKWGRPSDTHTEQERYDYLRKIVKRLNKSANIQVDGYGDDTMPENNGFILFPNHQGLFDVLALIDVCPKPFAVVIKKEASNIILVKQVVEFLRGIPIDRNDMRSSMNVIKQMTNEVKNGRNYVIFSEGTRSKNGNKILDFKPGTFKSAVNAKCPIIPVALIDSFKPFDISSIKPVTVQVRLLEPIYPDLYIGLKTLEIADIVHNRIQETINNNILENVENMG